MALMDGVWFALNNGNGRAASREVCWYLGGGQAFGDLRVDYCHDGGHSIKSRQRDTILGRWDGHTLNLGGVEGWLRSIVAL